MTSTAHSTAHDAAHDSQLDLRLQRTVDIAPELVWAAWTQPEHLTKWFTPSPWTTPEAEVDLRPGGIFRTVMCSPDGDRVDSSGCYLEVVENRRLVWTAALGPGYRPNDFSGGGFPFTAILTLEPTICRRRPPAKRRFATMRSASISSTSITAAACIQWRCHPASAWRVPAWSRRSARA